LLGFLEQEKGEISINNIPVAASQKKNALAKNCLCKAAAFFDT